MHYSTFSEIRDVVLNSSSFIIEDDTGIPFHYFDDNVWITRLHGVYEKPAKDFCKNRFQKILKKHIKMLNIMLVKYLFLLDTIGDLKIKIK